MSWRSELDALRREAIAATLTPEQALARAGTPHGLCERTVYGWLFILTRFTNDKGELRWQASASTKVNGTEENLRRILSYLGIPKSADLTPGGITVDGKVSTVRHYLWAADS